MILKKLFPLVLALLIGAAHAAVPVQIVAANVTTQTSLTIAFTAQNVVAGDTLVLEVYTASSAPTSVTESLSETVNNRVAYSATPSTSLAVYDVMNSAGNAKVSFTVNVASAQNITAILAEYAKSQAAVFDKATVVATAISASAASTSLTPAQSGELAVGLLVANFLDTPTPPTWTNGFAQESEKNSDGGNPPSMYLADQIYASTSALAATATLPASNTWSIAEVLYEPSGGSTCTDPGITQAGAIAVPTAASTVVRLKNGSFGTVDCSTVSYKQPLLGNFGVN